MVLVNCFPRVVTQDALEEPTRVVCFNELGYSFGDRAWILVQLEKERVFSDHFRERRHVNARNGKLKRPRFQKRYAETLLSRSNQQKVRQRVQIPQIVEGDFPRP